MNKTDANKVIKAFYGHQLKPLVFMTLFYGLRRSEVIGLRWENVDFENSTFEIKSTIVRHRTLIEKDTTKTDDSNAVFEMLASTIITGAVGAALVKARLVQTPVTKKAVAEA